PSTRTHSSFEVAAKRLSADVTNFDVAQSSITKGESVRETIETLQAMRTDYVIVRHKASGLPGTIARLTKASVINAGDGAHAHPTQALLDAFTIKEKFPDPAGKKVLITGDVLHSRVARSTSTILKKLGLEVAYLGPGSLVPRTGPQNIRRFTDYKEAMAWSPDIIYLLRVQMERQDVQFFPSLREYHKLYGITEQRLEEIRQRGLYLMHPGPVNRGVELCDAVMDYERSLINDQVENGIAVRMAVLYWLKPGSAQVA
ncbi:MAG: aspartate carbamoyltransferase catalytic subunit, partial [Akkermansiaceae bacterium]|nr:aspartate carbamoyltransferase catalytic subunit [Akkermansiaceae bacterium]